MGKPYPAYRPKAPERRLTTLYEGELLTEAGERLPASDWQALKAGLFTVNGLTLTGKLTQAPWLGDAIADEDASVLVSKHAVAGIRVRNPADRRKYRWLVPVSAWFDMKRPHVTQAIDPDSGELRPRTPQLAALRTLFEHCGAGVYPTPSSLGQALLKRAYDGPRLYRPNITLWEILETNLIGGRVDWLSARTYPRAWGQDMRMAYPAASRAVPCGTAFLFRGVAPARAATYFQYAEVRIPAAPLGPLPVRSEGHVRYDTCCIVRGWWWREELDDARMMGAYVFKRGKGYGWPALTSGCAPWAQEMHRLRRTSPDAATSGLVKRVAVAAIGRFSVDWNTTLLVPAGEGELWVEPDDAPGDLMYGVERRIEEKEGMLIHVGSYINMQVRRQLYAAALPYARRGTLIATNYDEVLTAEPPLHRAAGGLGGWKTTAYSDFRCPQPRWKEADGIRPIRPGFVAA